MALTNEIQPPQITWGSGKTFLRRVGLDEQGKPITTPNPGESLNPNDMLGQASRETLVQIDEANRTFGLKLRQASDGISSKGHVRNVFASGVLTSFALYSLEKGVHFTERLRDLDGERSPIIKNEADRVQVAVNGYNPYLYLTSDLEIPPSEGPLKKTTRLIATAAFHPDYHHTYELGVVAGSRMSLRILSKDEVDITERKSDNTPPISANSVERVLEQYGLNREITAKGLPDNAKSEHYDQGLIKITELLKDIRIMNPSLFGALDRGLISAASSLTQCDLEVMTMGMGSVLAAFKYELGDAFNLALGPDEVTEQQLRIVESVFENEKPTRPTGNIMEDAGRDWRMPERQPELAFMEKYLPQTIVQRTYDSRFRAGATMGYWTMAALLPPVMELRNRFQYDGITTDTTPQDDEVALNILRRVEFSEETFRHLDSGTSPN